MSYFHRAGSSSFVATQHVGGAWAKGEQHVAPALGLLVHLVETHRDARREDGLVVARLSYDILGVLPIGRMEARVDLVRAGRTIELVEAVLSHGGRDAVRLRAWLMAPQDTARLAGSALPSVPAPERMPTWDPCTLWPGGFLATVEVRRELTLPGRAAFWVRASQPLLANEATSDLSRAVGVFDIANGMAVRAAPSEVAFPNVDLTAHLFTQPQGDWVGFDTTVSFGPHGVGVTSSVLHDRRGPVGTLVQALTVRPS